MNEQYKSYLSEISEFIPRDRIYTDDLHCLAWGTDAGFYRRIPQIVVRSGSEAEVSHLLKVAARMHLPVTFRAAGTSLSGQAITDSILIVAGKNWEKYSVAPDGSTITMQPGIIGERVNQILKPYNRIFSPDPASKNSSMVGGIVINNASGMNCGTHANSDRMLKSIRIILADGTILDTGSEESRDEFRKTHPDFVKKIEELCDSVLADEALVKRIKYKYAIKNVTGLNIYPFVLFTDPFDIITHLMVGSEGTLGFASEFTMATGHKYSHSASAMLYFGEMAEACRAIVALKKQSGGKVHSAEILDKKSLASVNDATGEGLTAILTETKADSKEGLDANVAEILKILAPFKLFKPAYFTDKPEEYSKYWAVRSGIFPSVGGTRPIGTTVIIEDIAFHIDDLPAATVDLADMLVKHGYDDACIYGHALEGNYHFVIAQSFETEADVKKYQTLMQEIEHLVIDKYDGSLKAEHGTGRNMAPFVKDEWGEKAFGIMKAVKQLFDPDNLLNPGVIFNDDPECYIKGFKPMPVTNDHVNKCIECGFCEVNCVSCGFTLSSRQRIIIAREMSRLEATGEDPARLSRLKKQFKYYGNETCAGDGLCSTSCPMNINVGEMIHDMRAESLPKGSFGYKVGDFSARNFAPIKGTLRGMLSLAQVGQMVLGDGGVRVVGKALHKFGIPLWTPSLPAAHYSHEYDMPEKSNKKVVYFPSCINQTMGTAKNDPSRMNLVDKMVQFLKKAGWEVIFPENMNKLCCGTIWESKGMPDIAERMVRELEENLFKASQGGLYPVMCDQSPCLHRMRECIDTMTLYEPVEFIYDFVAHDLDFTPIDEPIAIHLTCSTRRMGVDAKFLKLANMCSKHVLVPEGVGCCAFAGDKGFTTPELNKYALRKLRKQIEAAGIKRGFSNSRTCEIGLTTYSGIPYQSIVYLVDECTRRKVIEENENLLLK
jgi:D-lactate dehydrogenase